jgi:signal peptidase complex subunit 3
LFNWNTKQVFLYITATWPSHKPSEPPSKAIIWDAILPSKSAPWHHNQYIQPVKSSKGSTKSKKSSSKSVTKDSQNTPGVLHLTNQRPKYQLNDPSGKIANKSDAILELNWNIQPWVGALVWGNYEDIGMWKGLKGGRSERFTFPELKGAKGADLKTEKGGEGNRGKPA